LKSPRLPLLHISFLLLNSSRWRPFESELMGITIIVTINYEQLLQEYQAENENFLKKV
jgi:hypothetical protein